MATEVLDEAKVGERLRVLALRFAAGITKNPQDWRSTAEWLIRLPKCQAIAETDDPNAPALHDGRFFAEVPDSPNGHPFYAYDDEDRVSRIWGPICRKMFNGWDAVLCRFRGRRTDVYVDFGVQDAKRIAFLGALTFNSDFDGEPYGISWSWEPPPESCHSFEGRGWAWAKISSGVWNEDALLGLMGKAEEYLVAKGHLHLRENPRLQEAGSSALAAETRAVRTEVAAITQIALGIHAKVVGEADNAPLMRSRAERIAKPTRGRPWASSPERDRSIAEAMASRRYRTRADLGIQLGLTPKQVTQAIDRHRTRS